MRDEAGIAGSAGSEEGTIVGPPRREPSRRRPAGEYAGAFLLEHARLTIEGAIFLRRSRGLLARV
jgi:hypothetical protein